MVAEPRESRIVQLGILLLYIATVAIGIVAHEPWFDEAQAWLLARDAGPGELLTHYLRYEGHPPLWYWLLSIPAKSGLPYKTINIVSAAVAICGVILLLRKPRVPLALKIAIPFSYFLAYQYTIVSRSYVLIFPLLMVVLWLYPHREERLPAFTAVLVLLSLVSLHGLSLAGAFALLYLVDLLRDRRAERAKGTLRPVNVRTHIICGAVLLITVAFIAFVLRPVHDLSIKQIVDLRFSPLKMMYIGTAALLDSMAGVNLFTIPMIVAFIVWFYRRGTLLTFAVLTLSLLPISSVYFKLWHEGLFFFVLLFAILLTFVRSDERARFDLSMLGVTVAILAVHLYWTARSIGYDIEYDYSGSRLAAEFIKDNHLERRRLFGIGFPALGLQPYFDHNIYANYPTRGGFCFWDWSTRSPWFYATSFSLDRRVMQGWFERQIAQQPEFVVLSVKFSSDLLYIRWFRAHPEYRIVQRFDGHHFWKNVMSEPEVFLLYARTEPTRGRAH